MFWETISCIKQSLYVENGGTDKGGRRRGEKDCWEREREVVNGELDKRMEAKEEELRSWKENKVYKEIDKRGKMGISKMWTMTKKIKN